jgi:Peroxisomal membrane protein (Pex16)
MLYCESSFMSFSSGLPSRSATSESSPALGSVLLLPPQWLRAYDDFITKNASQVSQIESALRSLTYIIPGSSLRSDIALFPLMYCLTSGQVGFAMQKSPRRLFIPASSSCPFTMIPSSSEPSPAFHWRAYPRRITVTPSSGPSEVHYTAG